jgi:hypothetical protein
MLDIQEQVPSRTEKRLSLFLEILSPVRLMLTERDATA